MGYTNFTECALRYSPLNESMQELYSWQGPVRLIPKDPSTQITTAACKILCGTGSDYYTWAQASGTITTWVLPIMGVILQAPFESNAFWETVWSLARWIGSPIASLSYILWNIKVSGKCALMADMAAPYDSFDEDRRSNFQSMRDSLYLLATLNQYSIAPEVLYTNKHNSKPAEGLLRVVLFSKDLRLLKRRRPPDELNAMRQKIAQQLRDTRRKGVVPVFLSTLWFLFAMAISIQSSFGYVGSNATAHDLALGCLLAWLPILILCGIIDRNPVSADDIRKKINRLIDHVRKSLMDEQVRRLFAETIDAAEERAQVERRINDLGEQCAIMGNVPFFEGFAGQARVRWHYGAAHPILCDIDDCYISAHGRHWLRDETRARMFLVLGSRRGGLDWLDYRELAQVSTAVFYVLGTTFGAWVLSFYTPTVGLGCRSGSYIVFIVIASALLVFEIVLWWYFDAKKHVVRKLKSMSTQEKWDWFFFRPTEAGNTVYLLYRTLAQTFGSDNTCDCMSSNWAPGGGYMDFNQWNTSNSPYVMRYWIIGTTIAVTVMGIAMIHICLEWCLQSHLSTSDARNAAFGLQRVRLFRRYTFPLRWVCYRIGDLTHTTECGLATLFKRWGVFNPDYTVRPVGLRWAKDSRPPMLPKLLQRHKDALPSSIAARDRSLSVTSLMVAGRKDRLSRAGSFPLAYARPARTSDETADIHPASPVTLRGFFGRRLSSVDESNLSPLGTPLPPV
ncbi:hypothetical protein BAUCODRAFT_69340 [Baudoinia panamericana UAMH 10762]|uniref:Uncharacterized protein n=1 Tax=Baudoinia panamericana (strain UAMH 10762) TaxID=717646 RepID=M2LPB9_BAUPA|nr:uncharacterized protein BAUCODRAFT_69340 [Baudoinia panamericana UAMH 10762]EMC96232.1 hypothetical protein BAUCODRAFT_69340 [Baudoinia panamericana UAMH 10762]